MNSERYGRVKELFAQATLLPREGRASFLAEACGEDQELKQQVAELLEYDQADPEFEGDFAPGQLLDDRYRIVDSLGEGGMGTVWRAEQDAPIRRTVAIKLIKAGMDSREVLARFAAERQALALMDHPNISRVFDAGMTRQGRPYFAMEFVEGEPLTEYCDRKRLGLRDRLELFVLICNAVQHAHQKGIIHRDLKPTNILVSTIDGKPVPKIIDFGLAKAIDQSLTDKTLQTAQGIMLVTPLYMSPEQADIKQVDIDTRSDVYSLGVILYELLTGTTPLEQQELQEAAVTEVLRIIREVDPPRPSTRLSASEALPSVAAQRSVDPRQLTRRVSGDLDWVVMRALEKEREARYASANGLAADILRHLADEPVTAGPPSARYRMRKFVKRNRAAVLAGTLVAAALLLGVIGTSLGLVWAIEERDRADEQAKAARTSAARSNAVASLLRDALSGVGPSVALGRDTELLEDVLERTAKRVETELAEEPEVEATIRSTLASTYEQLGLYDEASKHGKRALELYRTQHPTDHSDTAVQLNVLGLIAEQQGQEEEAEELYRKAQEIFSSLDSPTDDEDEGELLRNLATLLTYTELADEARTLLESAREKFKALHGNEVNTDSATVINALGNLERSQYENDKAKACYERALEIHRAVLPENHPFIAVDLRNLGGLLDEMNEFTEAESHLREAIRLEREVSSEHPSLAESLSFLSTFLSNQGRFEEAEETIQEALTIAGQVHPADHPDIRRYRTSLAITISRLGRTEDALRVHESVVAMDLQSNNREGAVTSCNNAAYSLMDLGRLEEADAMFAQAIEFAEEIDPGGRKLAMCMNNRARCLTKLKRFDEAIALFERTLEMRRALFGDQDESIGNTMSSLANAYRDQGDLDRAADWKRQAFEMYADVMGPDHLYTAIVGDGLAKILERKGEFEEAAERLQSALVPLEATYTPQGARPLEARARLGRSLTELGRAEEALPHLTTVLEVADSPLDLTALARIRVWNAECLVSLGRFAEAEPHLLEAHSIVADSTPEDSADPWGDETTSPSDALVELYDAWHAAEPDAGYDVRAADWRERD